MHAQVRRKLDRAQEALAFVRNNPFAGFPAAESLVQRLASLVERTMDLARVQQEREQARATGVSRKTTVRDHLTGGLLKVFAAAGRSAAKDNPALAEGFRPVPQVGAEVDFVTAARNLIGATRSNLALIQGFGIDAGMVDQAEALFAEYQANASLAAGARSGRIQARAEIFPVMAEIMNLLSQLDGLNRHRFAGDRARLAAWKSALRSPGPLTPREEKPADEEATPPAVGGETRSA